MKIPSVRSMIYGSDIFCFSVLLFQFLVASHLHSTITIIGLLRSQFVTFMPTTMQADVSQQSIGFG